MKPPVILSMLVIWLISGLLLSGCDSPSSTAPASDPMPVPGDMPDSTSAFQKGIVYASWWHGEYASSESDKTLTQAIKPLGVNWISIVVTCYQQNIASTEIQCKPETLTPTDSDLAHIIQDAHRTGLRVMLKPHVDLAGNSMQSRTEIGSGMNEAQWRAWFKSYGNFIAHYATVAQDSGADYFVVGSELVRTSARTEDWRSIVKTVRNLYRGSLTYAAHHQDEEFHIQWWDALDAIGIDAYYPLTKNHRPTIAQIKQAWTPIVLRLGQLSKKWARPVILTEVGYQSIEGANRTPWQTRGNTIEFEEQADSYQALFEAFSGQEWLHGVYWWVWQTNTASKRAINGDFNTYNKPADDVLMGNYGKDIHPTPPPLPKEDHYGRLIIFDNSLGTGWEDWSEDAVLSVDISRAEPVENTELKLSMRPGGALSLHHSRAETSPYPWLEFHLYVGKNTGARLLVSLNDELDRQFPQSVVLPNPRYIEGGKFLADQWQKVRIPMTEMAGKSTTVTRLNIRNSSKNQPLVLFIDEISLTGTVRAAPAVSR